MDFNWKEFEEQKIVVYCSTLEEEKDLNYSKKLLENLKKVKKKTTYTIQFKVEQDENNQWKVEKLDKDNQEKLLGIYS